MVPDDKAPTVTKGVDTLFKDTLTVKYEDHEYTFKIPSIRDKNNIISKAKSLRNEADPDGMPWGYTMGEINWYNDLATFVYLIKSSSAPWVYSKGADGKSPEVNIDNIPDGVPLQEVVDQFRQELEKFRNNGN